MCNSSKFRPICLYKNTQDAMGVTTINGDNRVTSLKNTPRIQKSLMIVLLVPRNKKIQVDMYMVDV